MFKKILSLQCLLYTLFILSTTIVLAQNPLGDVTGFEASEVGNRYAILKWNKVPNATGYKIVWGTNSVQSEEETYNRPPITLDDVNEYKVDNLNNNTAYYFSIFAHNDVDTSANYSSEITVTPSAEGPNMAPIINAITPLSNTDFNLTFSKPMAFDSPANLKTQLTIIKSFDGSVLNIQEVGVVNPTTLKVTTDAQDEGSEYLVTLKDSFKDQNGVGIEELERQVVLIGGSNELHFAANSDEISDLKISEIIVTPDNKAVEVVFSKEVTWSDTPLKQVAIVETAKPTAAGLKITEVIPHQEAKNKVLIVMLDEFQDISYTLLFVDLRDKDGKILSEENSTKSFTGTQSNDTQDSNEVVNLQATLTDLAKILINVAWGINPAVSAEDISAFKVYLAEGSTSTNFKLLGELTNDKLDFTTESLNPADLYKFKVTTVNTAGEESEGAFVEFELPGTGPAGLALLAFTSLGVGRMLTRKK